MKALPPGYAEHVAADSDSVVQCFWTSTSSKREPPTDHRVLPDGCVDVIARVADAGIELHAVGAMTTALVARTGGVQQLGVRFSPGWGRAALCVSQDALTDQLVDLKALSPNAVRWQESLAAHQGMAQLEVFRGFVRELIRTGARCPPIVQAATRKLTNQPSRSIAALADELGVTRQHLARLFASEVGLSPKMFARIARLRRTLAFARSAEIVDWAELAIDAGYFDQAHLAGEFRELVGLTPTRWAHELRGEVPFLQESAAVAG